MSDTDSPQVTTSSAPESRVARLLARLAFVRRIRAVDYLMGLTAVLIALSLAVKTPGMMRVDAWVTREVQEHPNDLFDRLAVAFTFTGNAITLAAIGTASALVFLWIRKRMAALLCVFALIGLPANVLLKDLVDRPRPPGETVRVFMPVTGYSFPSGHTMGAATLFGTLAFLAWVLIHHRKRRIMATLAFIFVAFGVSFSRIYLGAHWFSDVVGGWAAGLVLVVCLAELYKKVSVRELAPTEKAVSKIVEKVQATAGSSDIGTETNEETRAA